MSNFSHNVKKFLRPVGVAVDRALANVAASRTLQDTSPEGSGLRLIATSAHGSFGDEALLSDALRAAELLGVPCSGFVPDKPASWEETCGPGLHSISKYQLKRTHLPTAAGLAWTGQGPLAYIGADTISGNYEHCGSARRFSLLNAAARQGHWAGLVSVSMSVNASDLAKKLLRGLDVNVEVWARDAHSTERLQDCLGQRKSVKLSPDVGTFLPPIDEGEVSTGNRRKSVVVVPNAGVAKLGILSESTFHDVWVSIVKRANQTHDAVVLCHDSRSHFGDHALVESIARVTRSPSVSASFPRNASVAKSVMSHADVVVAARMHACVAALSSGVPCVGIDYLQKFRGTFDFYEPRMPVLEHSRIGDTSCVWDSDEIAIGLRNSVAALKPEENGWLRGAQW